METQPERTALLRRVIGRAWCVKGLVWNEWTECRGRCETKRESPAAVFQGSADSGRKGIWSSGTTGCVSREQQQP